MKIIRIISENRKTKRQTYELKGKITPYDNIYQAKVGYCEAIVEDENGQRKTRHMIKPG